jgi:5'-3' exonuclease
LAIELTGKPYQDLKILEIGPYMSPLITDRDVDTFDVLSHEDLVTRGKAENGPYYLIPPVTWIGTNASPEYINKKFDLIPTYEREMEKSINPYQPLWEKRYYKCLFKIENDEERIKQICLNYIEGLEWTMKYYTTGCPDWRWCYKYNYPPLLSDLIKYIPYFDTEMVINKDPTPVDPMVQLCYVIPKQSLGLLPKKLVDLILLNYDKWYKTDCEFIWCYCKYFWESHVELPLINVEELEHFIESNKYLLK